MSIIWTILIGFVVGLIARAIKPGNDSAGFIVTTVIGIVGSLIATYLGQAMGWYAAGEAAGFIASVVGAIVLLVVWGFIKRKT
ncbi:MAG: GlsB/YeaQ/YmgE family stress response membrane protein [Rhodocyclaceae bacterium]|nr:GlsB/YeaQ/YmgE family stress response membrane protein [Pseudomonadota bacterium]MDQ7972642.1 GlsB/YeaQ/YmgE family stress response membrane protein [Rhodocyclaceae bacterium]MDQ8001755.1 GlsB/YeaQ/YmgE family stress response membrane protein [Pseudomonadota bacterium]MDQ8018472.1 GlsB/YeaQ/YmgE family stress response membrane protein [Pseudomonadota bacterium]